MDAGQADVFRLRNRVATELWNDFARKPYYYANEPNVHTGVRGKVVEVHLNGEVALRKYTPRILNLLIGNRI